ncbi:MAG: DUF4157 domain-containing protein [Alphaproteobacteria bacterium]|nr:DUF4157 domain-containing protein [Alphaproteobacteria bacterium]
MRAFAQQASKPGPESQPAASRPKAGNAVRDVLRSAGQPLDPALRSFMEPRFGHDFGAVRVHANAPAAEASRDLHARAFASGTDIAFDAGEYRPDTASGRALIAHELAHVVQQHGRAPMIQRQPKTGDKDKNPFDFTLVDVEGRLRVAAVNRPTDPAEFLQAFEAKGGDLIDAEFRWISNNLIQFTSDVVLKEKRNPFANISVDTLREVTGNAYHKALGALAVKGVEKASGALLKLVHFGKKVIIVGEKAGTKLKTFGGILAWVGSAIVQFLIGPLFDKSKELVKQALGQFSEAVRQLVNEKIIPEVRKAATQFTKFMAALADYLLQDPDEPKRKVKPKGDADTFSVGEGDYKMTIGLDTSAPLSDQKRDEIILDLANVVLDIDAAIPSLDSDRSLYQDLALKTGVFSGDVAKASPTKESATDKPAGKPPLATYAKPFRVNQLLVGDTRFTVPKGATVAVTSEAHYDTDVDLTQMREIDRPPQIYRIDLYRASQSHFKGDRSVSASREYTVGKPGTSEWSNLDEGEYYLVIQKGGNPRFALVGNLRIDVRQP